MAFLDTNILLYSISTAPAEAAKRERAVALLETDAATLSVQVLQEFYVQATRQSRTDALPHEIAAGLVRVWLRFRVIETTTTVMLDALDIKDRFRISYWDAAVIAAARTAGCDRLYTEDLSHEQRIAGLRIVNPFL